MSEVMSFDNLITGNYPIVTESIKIGVSQTVKRGDVLKRNTSSGNYERPTAAVTATDTVVIAAEDITTDASTPQTTIGYKTGEFNEFSIRFGGSSTADDNRYVLSDKSIYLKKAMKA